MDLGKTFPQGPKIEKLTPIYYSPLRHYRVSPSVRQVAIQPGDYTDTSYKEMILNPPLSHDGFTILALLGLALAAGP